MKNIKIFISGWLSLGIMFFALAGSAQVRGGESGGGGGVLSRASGPVLMDFFNIDLAFKDGDSFKGLSPSRISKASGSPILITDSNMAQLRSENSAFEVALGTLQDWKSLRFDIAGMTAFVAFFEPLQWSYVEETLSANVHFPQGISNLEATAIAGYYRQSSGQYSVILNRPLWNQMGLLSQSGLLIHEGLRHVQIGYSAGFDEQSLQQATAILMMCKPKARLSYYVGYLMRNDPVMAKKLYGEFQEIIRTDCQRSL